MLILKANKENIVKFYHSTSTEKWGKIQCEGVLFGVRNAPSRCTYLAINTKDCPENDILLEVEYNPFVNPHKNNYINNCWQCRVYEPISQFKQIAL